MGNWPMLGFSSRTIYYPTSLTVDYIQSVCLSGDGANTMGAWIELVPSAPFDCILHYVRYHNEAFPMASELAFGADGSEVVVCEPIVSFEGSYGDGSSVLLPIYCPKGTRISVRSQCSNAVSHRYARHLMGCMDVSGFQGPNVWGNKIDSVGWIPAATSGTLVIACTVINTHGVWTEITSATDHDYKGFFLSHTTNAGAMVGSHSSMVDVGVGSVGNEEEILADLAYYHYTGLIPVITPVFPIAIPKGSRIAMRSHSSNATVDWHDIDFVLHGVR